MHSERTVCWKKKLSKKRQERAGSPCNEGPRGPQVEPKEFAEFTPGVLRGVVDVEPRFTRRVSNTI